MLSAKFPSALTAFLVPLLGFFGDAAAQTQQPEELPPPTAYGQQAPGYAPTQVAVAPQPPAPPPRPPRPNIARHYVEMTMGFIAGGRRYGDSTFESQNSVAPSLVEPFGRYPYDGINAFGLRYDLRATVTYIRMTIGVDIPFPSFRTADTQARFLVDGMQRAVSVQSLRPYELRFGIGGEYPVWMFAPFVDLIGAAYWANTALAVDDLKAEYRAQGFGFSLRGGCRFHMKQWFFAQVSAEAGVYGPITWNTELSLGFAIGPKRYSRDD
jgi:hypothetical protein